MPSMISLNNRATNSQFSKYSTNDKVIKLKSSVCNESVPPMSAETQQKPLSPMERSLTTTHQMFSSTLNPGDLREFNIKIQDQDTANSVDMGGSQVIDQEISDLIANNNLIEMHDILPTAFLLSSSIANDLAKFRKRFSDIHIGKGMCSFENVPEKHCKKNQWILKPAALNQGRGIQIFNKIRDILNYINDNSPDMQWVIQKYIERPLLYKQRKFDIRVWVLVHFLDDPNKFNVYMFDQGYLRTSSVEYKDDDTDLKVHLTNQCF